MMKHILIGVIFMVLFIAGNSFVGAQLPPPPDLISVPEPSSLLLLASGAASVGGIVLWQWKKK